MFTSKTFDIFDNCSIKSFLLAFLATIINYFVNKAPINLFRIAFLAKSFQTSTF